MKDKTLQDGYRYLDLNDNNVRNCFEIIDKDIGWVVSTRQGYGFGKAAPKFFPTKDYYECIRRNNKLNEQKILQLTKELLSMKRR